MNTVSLLVNGRTAVALSTLPEKQRSSITSMARPSLKASTSGLSYSAPRRPSYHRRQSSRDSPGWYNTEDGMTLDDFARRLNTTTKRIEQWQGKCAQNVVMALMRPTPIVLFVFNPVSLLLWIMVALWFVSGLFASRVV